MLAGWRLILWSLGLFSIATGVLIRESGGSGADSGAVACLDKTPSGFPRPTSEELTSLRAENGILRTRNQALEAWLAATFSTAGIVGSTAPGVVSPEPETADPSVETADPTLRTATEALDARLSFEARDETWRQGVEAAIQARLQSVETTDGWLNEVICGSTVCRVSLTYESPVTRERILVSDGDDDASLRGEILSRPVENGGPPFEEIIYIARDGLPLIPQVTP